MNISNLTERSDIYTSNVYFIRGNWNSINDVNTLVDTGRDPSLLSTIKNVNSGLGKKKIEKIILTHNHYDHVFLAPRIKKIYNAKVYAFHKESYVDVIVKERMLIKAGDRNLEVIHTPGHTFDSICLWEPIQKILFSGDTNFDLLGKHVLDETLSISLKKLSRLDIKVIYPGHGPVIYNQPS